MSATRNKIFSTSGKNRTLDPWFANTGAMPCAHGAYDTFFQKLFSLLLIILDYNENNEENCTKKINKQILSFFLALFS